ncbi:zinc finger BED domain-containing protein 4-like [Dysidea avara]|uniref:zinc finger BED domain-containing protein 4-like n=1 Tax=Dysidea avara TaxID=196820 RepID=UPI003317FC16
MADVISSESDVEQYSDNDSQGEEDEEDNGEDNDGSTTATSTSEETRKYKSQVWKFFTKKNAKSVVCTLCNKSLAYHGGTSSMLQHLSRKHPAENVVKTSDGRKQTNLDVFTRKRACSNERAGAISDRIASFIVKDLHPINLVAGKGFKDLMTYLEPGYHLPSATHFTHLIERKYDVVKERVRHILQEQAVYIAITADLWTSVATESYITVTFHYLDAQWQMKSVVSGTLPLFESHTANNIVTWIKELVDDVSIATEKVVAFVHDNCKNIENAGNSLEEVYGWFSLGCAGHTLQLCVNAGLKTPAISNVVAAGRHLTTHFHKSDPALRALRNRQRDMRVEQHQFIQDVKTRWNSTYYMIERFIEQRWPLTAVMSDSTITKSGDRNLDLKSEHKEFNVSSSALYPVLHGLLKSLQCVDNDLPAIQQCKTTVAEEIKQRWKLDSLTSIDKGRILKNAPLISCIVDPRFKECTFLGANKQFEVKTALTTLVCEEKESYETTQISHPEESNGPVPKKKCSGLDILLGDDYTNGSEDNESDSDPILNEVDLFSRKGLLIGKNHLWCGGERISTGSL